MSYFLDEFGKKVKGYRELCGYSQEKLAEKVDVSTKTIVFWETGKSFIEYPTLCRLCKVFGIEEVELFNFQPEKSETLVGQISSVAAKLSPAKQKQVLDIVKTFEQD